MSQEGLLSIEAGSTSIRLSRPMLGSLVSIIDRNTGHDFLRPTAEPAPMWEALLTTPAGKKTLSSKHADQFEVETSKSHRHGKKLRLTWSHFPEPFGEAKATADVEFNPLVSQIEFRMTEFDPGRENGVWQLDFPIIGGVDEIRTNGRGDRLSVPLLQGLLVHNPLKTIVSNERVKRTLHGTYPGLLTMQFFAYYNEEVAGLYLATHDALGYRKDFLFDAGDDQKGRFRVRHFPENIGFKGRVFSVAYPMALVTFRGGWPEAAETYRRWAVRQAWCRMGKLRYRTDLSRWVRETSLWVWNRGKAERVSPGAIEIGRRTGVNTAIDWYWWHHNPYDVFVPEYLPPREGVKTFVEAVKKLQSNDVKVVAYINGRIWDMGSGSWMEQHAEKAAALDEDLKPYKEVYNIFMPDHVVAPMCPTTRLWKDKVAFLVESLVRDLSLDGVYIDQVAIAPANLCHNPEHDHPVGGGYYWVHGYYDLIRTARDVARKANPDACLLSESCIEQFIDCFDGFLTLDSSWERTGANLDLSWDGMGYNVQAWEPIPLFNAIYHDYAITFGSYTSMTGVPPYDDLWPESSRPPEYGRFATFNDKYPDQFAFELARTLVWGIQPMVTNVYPEMLGRKEFEEDMAFLEIVAGFHSKAKEYLTLGSWLPPPVVECPLVAVKMLVRSIYTRPDMVREVVRESPSILASAWGTGDGRCCVVLANFTRDPVNALLKVDLDRYGFTADEVIKMTEYPDKRTETRLDSHRVEKMINIGGRSIVAYEFSSE